MSCWSKEQLENMLEDVINELDLSEEVIEKHGPLGTPPAELVRLVLDQKDREIKMLKAGFKAVPHKIDQHALVEKLRQAERALSIQYGFACQNPEYNKEDIAKGLAGLKSIITEAETILSMPLPEPPKK